MDTVLTPQEITEHLLRERLALTACIGSVTKNHHLAEDVYQGICVKAVSHPVGGAKRPALRHRDYYALAGIIRSGVWGRMPLTSTLTVE